MVSPGSFFHPLKVQLKVLVRILNLTAHTFLSSQAKLWPLLGVHHSAVPFAPQAGCFQEIKSLGKPYKINDNQFSVPFCADSQ
jgi:hypothetical protein